MIQEFTEQTQLYLQNDRLNNTLIKNVIKQKLFQLNYSPLNESSMPFYTALVHFAQNQTLTIQVEALKNIETERPINQITTCINCGFHFANQHKR